MRYRSVSVNPKFTIRNSKGFLLELDDCSDDPQVETAWEQEILARIQAVEDGSAVGTSYEDVMSEAENHLAP